MTDHQNSSADSGYTEAEGHAASLRQMAQWADDAIAPATPDSQRIDIGDIDTDELRAAADYIERITGVAQAAVVSDPGPLEAAKKLLINASVGSCTCNTKSPELMWHAPNCRYVTIMMALENVEIASQPSPAATVEVPQEVMERRRKGLPDYERPPLGQPPSWLQEQEKKPAPHSPCSAGNDAVAELKEALRLTRRALKEEMEHITETLEAVSSVSPQEVRETGK